MATKTIALEVSVYDKLARQKRSSESFTKTIERLIEQNQTSFTCVSAVTEATRIWRDTSEKEADKLEKIIAENRASTRWEVESLE